MKETREIYCCDERDENEIVISGISGRFYNCDNIQEFNDYVYSKRAPEVVKRDKNEYFVALPYISYLRDLSKFDAKFFSVPKMLAHNIDPQLRMLFEVVYEAIVDSGYTLDELSKMSIGTYCSSSTNPRIESEILNIKMPLGSRTIAENYISSCAAQISHFFNFKGPSLMADSGCASSMTIFKEARDDIRKGKCDMAVITGIHLEINALRLIFQKIKAQMKDGFSRPFDAKAAGFTPGESISALVIQRAGTARRSYASIVDVQQRTMGYSPQGIYAVNAESQLKLLRQFYNTVDVDPLDLEYIELHGTGTQLGDVVETESAAKMFCNDRKGPLLIGTAKSNFGHCEEVSGIVGMLKIVLAFETGQIAPNVNFETPNPECTALVDGRLKVVVEPTDISSDYISLNNYGIGGVMLHGCFKRNPLFKKEDAEMNRQEIPKLYVFSSPTKEGLECLMNCAKTHGASKELTSILHKIAHGKQHHLYRGYLLNRKDPTIDIQKQRRKKRPLFYIFSSMGCQWPGMGLDLLKFEVFSNSIMKSAEILKELGIDLLGLLKPTCTFDSQSRHIIPAFVSITAIQIALVDLLKSLNLQPDGIIGHSTGEMACAYADGCCTAEQVLLLSYWRGKSVENADLIKGKMATIALSMEEAQKLCPKDVYVVCHNAPNLVTISGPTAIVNKFLQQLKGKGILSVIVRCYNYAFHSVHVAPAVSELQRELNKVLCNPRKISHRWISSSYTKEELHLPEAKTADASYFVHNLLSPVRFYEALKEVPKDAVLLEIGPHHMFESILKQVVGPDADFLGLMREKTDNAKFLLENVGKLHNAGFDPVIENLYPPIQYPVPRNTPMLSSCVKWDHTQACKVIIEPNSSISIDLNITECAYLKDHAVTDKILFPGTGYLIAAWQIFATANDKRISELPVIFEHVRFLSATLLPDTGETKLYISISNETGCFEIKREDGIAASGFIHIAKEFADPKDFPRNPSNGDISRVLTTTNIHDMMRIFGFNHGPEFQNILEYDIEESKGLLRWRNNWITFLDSMLAFMFINAKVAALLLPVGLEFVKIDPLFQHEVFEKNPDFLEKGVPVFFDAFSSSCVSAGAEIRGSSILPSLQGLQEQTIVHEAHVFVPFIEENVLSLSEKELYNNYHDCCIKEASAIAHLLKNNLKQDNGKEEVSDFTMIPPENQLLLNTLKILHGYLVNRGYILNPKQTYNNYLKKIHNDYLIKTILTDETLKKVLDIIEENVFEFTLQAVEISSSCFPISFQMSDLVKKTHFKKWEFTVAHGSPSIINPELFKKRDVTVEKSSDWGLLESKSKHVLICSFLGGSKPSLHKFAAMLSSIHTDGFFVVLYRSEISEAENILQKLCESSLEVHPLEVFEEILAEEQILTIARKSDSLGMHLYLLKSPVYQDTVIIRELRGGFADWVPETVEAVKQLEENKNAFLWIVCIGDPKSGILGFVNCLQREANGERIKCLYVNDKNNNEIPNFDKDDGFYANIVEKALLFNVYKDDAWGTYRHKVIRKENVIKECRHIKAGVRKITDLSSLRWTNSSLPLKYKADDLIEVYYAALNFHDVVIATGRIIEENSIMEHNLRLGSEFAGRNSEGKRVLGIADSCLASTICTSEAIQWNIPDRWTMEQACTVPIVYTTCFFALLLRGKLQNGEKILIHSGTGGIGQAAINIALSMDCEIFVTVGNAKKLEYLLKKFPQLKPENIGYSRDTSFKNAVLQQTKGKGVDIILNFLVEDKLQAGLECLAPNGRFVEIGKYDSMIDNFLYLESLPENASFMSVHLKQIVMHANPNDAESDEMKKLKEIMKEYIEKDIVKPLDATIFEKDKVEEAFRFVGAGKHLGKVFVKIRDEEPELITQPTLVTENVEMITFFYPTKCYVIIGGLGGFAMALVEWMISSGAKNFVLSSRSGSLTGYHTFKLGTWRNAGINIEVAKLDASNLNEAEELLLTAEKLGPVGGVFNLALVLKDAIYTNQTPESFAEACAPKVPATENLDNLTRSISTQLDWFVCFSSIASGKGNGGQTNYGYGNSVMERICELRRKDGLHGLAIQWGVIGDVGVVHRNGLKFANSVIGPQPILSCLISLDELLHRNEPVVCCFLKNVESDDLESSDEDHWKGFLKLIGVKDENELDRNSTLNRYSVDSLTLTEIRRYLQKKCNVDLRQDELLEMTIGEIENLCRNKIQNAGCSLSPVVGLPWISKANKVQLNKQTKGTPLFIMVSGSHIYELKAFSDLLKVPVYGILTNRSISSPPAEYESFIKEIQDAVHKGQFNLAGYGGDGAIIATKIAIKMNRSPHKYPGLNCFFNISGQLAMRNIVQGKQTLSTTTNIDTIVDIIAEWTESDVPTLKEEFQKLGSREEQIDLAADFLLDFFGNNIIEKQTIKDTINQELAWRESLAMTSIHEKLMHDIQFFEIEEDVADITLQEMKTQLSTIYKGKIDITTLSTYGSSLLQVPWCSDMANILEDKLNLEPE